MDRACSIGGFHHLEPIKIPIMLKIIALMAAWVWYSQRNLRILISVSAFIWLLWFSLREKKLAQFQIHSGEVLL